VYNSLLVPEENQPTQATENAAGTPEPPAVEKPKQPRKLVVEISKDDQLTPFEVETLALARQTAGIAQRQERFTFWAVVVGGIAALLVLVQIMEMSLSNQILATQTESAIVSANQADLFTREQLKVSQQQVKAAQDSVIAVQNQVAQEQRARLVFDPPAVSTKYIVGQPIALTILVKNIGRTPARNYVGRAIIEIVKQGHPPTFSYRRSQMFNRAGAVFQNFGIPFQILTTKDNPQLESRAEPAPLSEADFENVHSGKAYIAVYGRFDYQDIFGKPHWLTFCFYEDPSGTPVSAYKCTQYNDVDSD